MGIGFPSFFEKIKHTCIVGGDAKFMAIAAASVIAKIFRDRWMQKFIKNSQNMLGIKTKISTKRIAKLFLNMA